MQLEQVIDILRQTGGLKRGSGHDTLLALMQIMPGSSRGQEITSDEEVHDLRQRKWFLMMNEWKQMIE